MDQEVVNRKERMDRCVVHHKFGCLIEMFRSLTSALALQGQSVSNLTIKLDRKGRVWGNEPPSLPVNIHSDKEVHFSDAAYIIPSI
jgi:hypothetical protein